MHQTKKGNQWYFGMKGHIGVDSKQKIIHSIDVTPANVHDSQIIAGLLDGTETEVWGDSACADQKAAFRKETPKARDMTNKRSTRHKLLKDVDRLKNRTKSKFRSTVEYPFLISINIFGFSDVRYRGLGKNRSRFDVACARANL